MKELYFPIGISGSGKSTYIKKHFKPEVVVSPDDLRRQFTGDVTDHSQEGRVWAIVPKLLQQKLDKYNVAVLDATNVDSGSRASLLKKFNRDLVKRIAIVFEADPEESKRRIKADLEAGKDRSDVPDDVVDKQQEKFKRGYNTIKQQFDEVIYADRGDNVMSNKIKKEDIEKIRKMVNEEMRRLKEEDAQEAEERAKYQAYQDMYLVPQSNWRVKKYTEMYDGDGNLYRGQIGEIHRIQTVEYDFMHTGEVVTECGDMTYTVNAEDFRECFEMVNDEEGLKVNNESLIKEEVRKLVKIKDYFGKNIKGSIERLEEIFLTENLFGNEFIVKIVGGGMKNYISKYDTSSITYVASKNPFSDQNVKKFTADEVADFINEKKPKDDFRDKLFVIDRNGKQMDRDEFFKEYVKDSQTYKDMMARQNDEPEDAYLDQDFEDRISGYEDNY